MFLKKLLSHNLNILISKGSGSGRTELSAFDNALYKAGIANHNLIKLSSVIPPHSLISEKNPNILNEHFGSKLYVVISSKQESMIGKEAWSGIGWVQTKDGRGLFVEHEASSEEEIKEKINFSLEDMVRYRSEEYGNIHYVINGAKCVDKPVSSVVAAIYKLEKW